MNSHGLTKENLVATLPVALQKDPSAVALAKAMAELLAQRPEEIDRLRIYPYIDRLDERMLDILAYDFKVDWWDQDCSLEQKRRLLKSSWRVHKVMGTRAAVEAAASAVYPWARIQEWYEYGGEPYWFRLDVDMPEDVWTPERHRRLMWQLQYYKSLRSHLDKVIYRLPAIILENSPGSFRFQRLKFPFLLGETQSRWKLEQIEFLVSVREELRSPQAAAHWIFQIGKDAAGYDMERAVFQSLRIPLRARSYGWNMIFLDGSHRLDGGWLLNQHFRGMAWDRVRFTVSIREQEAASGAAFYGFGSARTRNRAAPAGFQARCGALERPGEIRPERVKILGAFRERNTLSGTLTRDTMWYLNGAYRMDEGKKLNAHITREEI